MSWDAENVRYKELWDERKKAWNKVSDELGNPRFVPNDARGWRQISLVPQNQVWSYCFDPSLKHEPRVTTHSLKFGVVREAMHFLVFDEPWFGGVEDVVISHIRTCSGCDGRGGSRGNAGAREGCFDCSGQGKWVYPANRQSSGPHVRDSLAFSEYLNTTFAQAVLQDIRTPTEILITAAQRGNMFDRLWVARNPNCPIRFLNDVLAKDSESLVREQVAERAHFVGMSPRVIAQLCDDESAGVRATMARHKLSVVGLDAYRKFANDEALMVRARLAANADVPSELIQPLLPSTAEPENLELRLALAGNEAIDANANLELLTRNFEDLFPTMFYELLSRPGLSSKTIHAIKSRISEEDFRLRGFLDAYPESRPPRRTLDSQDGLPVQKISEPGNNRRRTPDGPDETANSDS